MMKMLYLLLIVWGAYTAEASTCKTVWEDKCMDVPRQECRTVQKPYPVTRSEEECNTFHDNQCSTVFDTEVDVVDRQECQTVKVPKHVSMPVKICDEMPEQKCETKYAEECYTEYKKECSTNYEVVCGDTLYDEVCDMSNDYMTEIKKEKKCHLETETQCHDTPFTDCQTVKNPVTKYRDEEECKTVYDQVCIPSYEESCHTVTERQCKTVTETECDHNNRCWDEKRDECWDEPRQECKQMPKKHCNNVPRQKCTTVHHPYTDFEDVQECTTINKPVCRQVPVYKCYDVDTPVNHLVPRRKCQNQPRKVCKKVHKQDCKDVPRQKCDSVPKQDCQTLPTQDCRIEYNQITSFEDKEECRTVQDKVDRKVARQVCNKVPRKECRQVPVTETVFKDETECYTVNERKCTKVSTKSCSGPPVLLLQVSNFSVTELPCCQAKDVQLCQKIYIDTAVLGKPEVEIVPFQQIVKNKGKYGGGANTYNYGNDRIGMNVFYDPVQDKIYGSILDYSTGDSYKIRSCRGNVVLKKLARGKKKSSGKNKNDLCPHDGANDAGVKSCTIMPCEHSEDVYYSVKVFFTSEVQNLNSMYNEEYTIYHFVDELIMETNQGYMNSRVPIRVELSGKPEILDNEKFLSLQKNVEENLLDEFAKLKRRGNADAALLLFNIYYDENDSPTEGVAYGNDAFCDGDTYSVVNYHFATKPGNYVFGHELAHHMNCEHDDAQLIGDMGTIMYVKGDGGKYEHNRYSDTNAQMLRKYRCNMAKVGKD